jgi:hypothetical protein
MNTDHLAKLYDALTARERLPLIIAAAARDDGAEQKRLSASAPKETLQVPGHFRLARALAEAVHYHLLNGLGPGRQLLAVVGPVDGTQSARPSRGQSS